MTRHALVAAVILVLVWPALAQEPYEGQTLVSPLNSFNSSLVDMDGTVVRTWHGSQRPASMRFAPSN